MKKRILQTLLLATFALLSLAAYAQNKVSGVVKGDDGGVMPGVSVQIKGTTIGTLTDINGRYTISVPNAQSILVFSFLGMATFETEGNG
jgi:hypothetical protein